MPAPDPATGVPRIPSLRKHKATGQARVRLNGRDVYLGAYGSAEAKRAYARLIAEHLAGVHRLPGDAPDLTVSEVAAAYVRHARDYYGPKQRGIIKVALRPLRRLYGPTRAADFGPVQLRTLIDGWIRGGLSRTTTVRYASVAKAMFRWAVAEGSLPPVMLEGLRAVQMPRAGRTAAPEPEPVKPVADAVVARTLAFCPPVIRAMIELQRLTGCRPGEVVGLCTGDIETTGKVWVWTPRTHKNAWRGQGRTICLGPRAQEIVGAYLRTALDEPIFQPCESERQRAEARHAARQTPLSCGNRPGTNRRRRRQRAPGCCYTTDSYRRAIARACEGAGVDAWSPNQLRHARATELRKRYGIDAAGVVLGHAKLATTAIYAERDLSMAMRIAAECG